MPAEPVVAASPARRVPLAGLGRRRLLAGLAFAAVALPVLTVVLVDARSSLSLEGQVLLYLLTVVLVALVGGMVPAVLAAVSAAMLINYHFVEPLHTLDVGRGDQGVALAVFIAVAALVSGAVELATRRARAAEAAVAQAEMLSSLAGTDLDGSESLRDVLDRARQTLGMQSVALCRRDRASEEWVEIDRCGPAAGEPAPLRFDVPAGDLRLVGRGPAVLAEDQRVLRAFAAAAQTAYEGRQLTAAAREGRSLAVVDRQRTALLAAVGHDLRTPLAGIKAAVSSLRQTDMQLDEPDRGELLATIEHSADRLDGIVTNLLDASRLQAGALVVHAQPVALDEVVGAALLAVAAPPGRVEVRVPDDLPLVQADPGLLERVFVNLIDNAVRHGGEGRVVVTALAGAETAKVEVLDHGPGLPETERERIFEPFRQVGDQRTAGGIGLGLAVARGFVQAMGGALAADRATGGGLLMRLRLPLAAALPEAPP